MAKLVAGTKGLSVQETWETRYDAIMDQFAQVSE